MKPVRLTREQVAVAQQIKERAKAWEQAAGTEHFPLAQAEKLVADAIAAELPEVAWFGLNLLVEITRQSRE